MQRFKNQPIVITGAGTGIGRAIAVRLASEGARVSLIGRRRPALEEVLDLCLAAGAGAASAHTADIREPASIDRAITDASATHGPLFACIANSGIGGSNSPGPDDRWHDIVRTNLDGTYFTLRAAQRHLQSGPQRRHFVVTSSILARIGVPGYTGYCASKAGLLGLVRALAMELAKDQVQVNAICPGWVETEMAWEGLDGMARAIKGSRDDALKLAMRDVPLRRMGKPEEVAGLVGYLLSEDAHGITGQGIDMNGGAWMG